MANPQRGEVAANLDGQSVTLRLSLGALAELEDELGAGGLVALAERFESGDFSARDLMALLAAGIRGAGGAGTAEDVGRMTIDGGGRGRRSARGPSAGGYVRATRNAGMRESETGLINWSDLMRAGLGGLRLSPDVFWTMTPRELTAAIGAVAAAPMTRSRLQALAQEFPDTCESDAKP